jgi:hypothetical protein
MIKRSGQIMLIVLLLMLLQFFTPFILPVVAQEVANIKEAAYQIQHNSVATPLLNEKEERELDAKATGNNQIPLLDLTIHSLNLQASHSGKTYYFHTEIMYRASPPLFEFLKTFLI